jgi:hypothetical protein
MHIKNIHCIIEKLAETTKVELDKGIENVDTKEMGEVADIIKDLAEAEYYAKISKAMDEAEYGEDYDYMGAYDEHERKGYRGQRRDSRGRYMSRRGYESRMMPEMRWEDMEYERDMDRPMGRMGYSNSNTTSGSSMSGNSNANSNMGYSEGNGGQYSSRMQRDSREGKSGQMRRGYMEAKEKGADKQQKMKELEDYMKELSSDVTEMIGDASPEEKAMLKNKMQVLMQKIQ